MLCTSGFTDDVMFLYYGSVAESIMTLCLEEFAKWRYSWRQPVAVFS